MAPTVWSFLKRVQQRKPFPLCSSGMGLEGVGSGILMWRPWQYWGAGGSVWKKQVAQEYGDGGGLGEKVLEPVI